jgi:hypothetical protein
MRFLLALALLVAFPACSDNATGQSCGGNTSHPATCPSGYTCVSAYDGQPGDLPGVCKKNN